MVKVVTAASVANTAGVIDQTWRVDEADLAEVFDRAFLKLEVIEKVLAELFEVLERQSWVGHRRAAIERHFAIAIRNQRKAVVRRSDSGSLDAGTGQVIDEGRFARRVISQAQHRGHARDETLAAERISEFVGNLAE